MLVSCGYGRATAGITDLTADPRVPAVGRPPVIYMPGASYSPVNGLLSARPTIEALTVAGFCVMQPNVDQLFGNATAMSRIADAVAWLRANRPVSATAPPVLVGISNGGICSLQYARQNTVSCAVTVVMPVDLEWLRVTNSPAGIRASLDAAWGVTYPTPLPTHGDLLTDRSAYTALGAKVQQWVSSNDPLDNTATGHSEHEFATFIGSDYHSAGAVGHADTSWSGVDPATVLAFVQAHT